MPEFVTLYTYNPTLTVTRTVIRSTIDPTFIDYTDYSGGGSTPQPPDGVIVAIICQPGTFDRYTYKVSTSSPFATYTKEINSDFCGYVPPACDINLVTFATTDETEVGLNNGTVNMFCTSSFLPITYFMSPPLPDPPQTNTTGYFTGLKPGTSYYINATDTNACSIHRDFVILPFSDDLTHFKYRLQFKSADLSVQWELQLYDMLHNYLKADYPKDVTGNSDPVVYKKDNPDENKFTPIIATQLDITLEYTGLDFTPDEFNLAPANSWFVQLMKDGEVEFKGYLLPDEGQNLYADKPYFISLKATDGLPSLKGNFWGNGSGGYGYGTYQIQQYGLTKWCLLIKQCLDQLGYDYGYTHVVSSLRFNNAFSSGLWSNIGCWSDILYSSSGVPMSTYDALATLLAGLKLTIFQHKGEFYLVNWNDLWYINNGVVSTEYNFAFYFFPPDFNTSLTGGTKPDYTVLGFDQPFKPINPPQHLNYDKAYNIEQDVSFNILSLLYENPSFEIGAVQGELPLGFQRHGTLGNLQYCNYDPVDPSNPQIGAADGSWELREDWIYQTGSTGDMQILENYIDLIDPVVIDQPGLWVNLSFEWRPKQVPGLDTNTVPGFAIMFTTGGVEYIWDNAGSGSWTVFTEPPNTSEIGFISHPSVYTNGDYISWQPFSMQTKILPGSQIGTLNIRFYPPFYYYHGTFASAGVRFIADVDVVNITTSSANPAVVNQIGEKHISTVVTGLPQADLKQQDISLFTYPPNKRMAGNIFYGSDYSTAIVANTWSFALKKDALNRLPAIITNAYAREYQRCMNKFQGDISSAYVNFYSVFGIRFMDDVVCVPFSVIGHLRTDVWQITLIEISDADAQTVYQYIPEYEKQARNN